jgi:ABC-type xylose transport system substrate-binding protein
MSEVEVPEAKDPFERLIALSVAILAVVLAFVDNTGNNGQADAIVKTNLASNQWAYYQAKSLKENLSANNAELLAALAPNDAAKAKVEELNKQAARYEAEKKEIKDKAEALTKEAEHGQSIDDQCDIAALLLQIAVVICSIAILVRWKAIYFVGLAVGVAGVYEGIVAFLM